MEGKEKEGTNLSAESVWQDLGAVSHQETRPGGVVEDVVQENEEDLSIAGCDNTSLDELSSADGPGAERNQHSRGSEEEERTSSELVDEETRYEGTEEVDDVQNTVDLQAKLGTLHAGLLEDITHVVRH
jgi:hypothetical protein